MRNNLKINYQKAYGRSYYEAFIASQKTERDKNFSQYLNLILKEKKDHITRVLDSGCGQGGFLKICEDYGIKELYGVDVSKYAIQTAGMRTKAKLKEMNLENSKLPYSDHFFDLVVAIDVIEHLFNTDFFFKEVARVLKEDGIFFLTTENSKSLFDKLFSSFFPHHDVHINLQKEDFWTSALLRTGFKNAEIKGIVLHGFPPLLGLRNLLRKFKIPVSVHPIFSPLRTFSGTLIMFARK